MLSMTNLIAIILIIIGKNRNKFIMSLVSALVLTITLLFINSNVDFMVLLMLFVVLFFCVLISFCLVDKIDPDNTIMYVILWEVIYTIVYTVFNLMLSVLLNSYI